MAPPTSRPGAFRRLRCLNCQRERPLDAVGVCPDCGGPVESEYDLDPRALPAHPDRADGIWAYAAALPPVDPRWRVTLGEGATPYLPLPRLARSIGIAALRGKWEGTNPTGSFKDRAAALGVSLARSLSYRGVFAASSGNAAAAIAACSARAGLPCLILARDDMTEEKMRQLTAYGPEIVRVRGLFDSRATLERGLAAVGRRRPGWRNLFVWSPWNPLLTDALRTIAFEIAREGDIPDAVAVPVAGGDILRGIYLGFEELRRAGAIRRVPRFIAAQSNLAAPTVRELSGESGGRWPDADRTLAGALRVGFPSPHAVEAVRASGGWGVAVPDRDSVRWQARLARDEGIFCEVSSAVALAAVARSRADGRLRSDDRVAVVLTGAGYKDYSVPVGARPPAVVPAARLDRLSRRGGARRGPLPEARAPPRARPRRESASSSVGRETE